MGGGWGLCRGHPQAVALVVQLSGSIWSYMVTPGEVQATERESLAFWFYVGTISHQGQGVRKPKCKLSVQVGLDMEFEPWQVAWFQHPSAKTARQVAPCPGLIQLAQDQLCQPPSHLSPSSYDPAGPKALGWHTLSDVRVLVLCVCDMQPHPEH